MEENWLKRVHKWKISMNTILDYKAKENIEIGSEKLSYKYINSK